MSGKMTKRLRNLMKTPGILVKPGAYNALSAKIIETAWVFLVVAFQVMRCPQAFLENLMWALLLRMSSR